MKSLSHLVAAADGISVAQARQEAIAQRLAAATTPADPSSGGLDPAPATPPTSSCLAASDKVASVRCRLEATLARAARPSLTAETCVRRAGRTPLSSGRRPSVAGGGKSMFSISCDNEDKENSPALGKVVTPSLEKIQTPVTAKIKPPFPDKVVTPSSWMSPQQPLAVRPQKPAQLSAFTKVARQNPLAPLTEVVDPTPRMTPHALQLSVVAMPFWGLQADVPEAAATEAVPTAAASAIAGTTTTAATTAGPPIPAAPLSAGGDLTTAAAGLTTCMPPTAGKSQVPTMTVLADAEQANVASNKMVPDLAKLHLPSPAGLSGRRAGQGKPCTTIPTAVAASQLSPPRASSRASSRRQISTGRQSIDSLAASTTAGAAKQTQARGSKRHAASAAAPAASQMVTRSQAAARKHVERMQTRSRQCKRIS